MITEEQIQQLAIQKSREGLKYFCLAYDRNYEINWHHREICEALERIESGESDLLLIECPPRHGKSQLSSIYFPAWYLGRNPNKEIITASYSGDLAKTFGAKTRDIIGSEMYQGIFNTKLKADSKSKDKWNTDAGGSYVSVGRGGATTGRGANIFIVDDPFKDREEAESQTIRDKVWDWYRSVVYTRLEKGGAVVIIQTRWHLDDLIGRVERNCKETGKKYEKISFPAVAIEEEPNRQIGEALWVNKYPLERLNEIKSTIGLYDWSALYQQNPITAETQEFKQEYFKYFEEEDLKEDIDIDITIDPAISKKKGACRSAVVSVAKRAYSPNWYILNTVYGQFDPLELINVVFKEYTELRFRYPQANIRVYVEAIAYQQSLKFFIEEEMRRRKEYFVLEEFRDMHDKEQRIRGLVPLYRTGVIFHRDWMKDLEEELMTFPRGLSVDIADALSFHIHIKPNTIKMDILDLVGEEEKRIKNSFI